MPNKIYQNPEAAITWRSSGGTYAMTCTSLGAAAGRQGAEHNFAGARSRWFEWRAFLKPGGTRVVGEAVHIYLKRGDGTHYDNDDGTGDIAVSALDKLRNCQYLGTILIDENAAVEMSIGGLVEIVADRALPIFWNATANALSATAGDFGFDLTPAPDEIQNFA